MHGRARLSGFVSVYLMIDLFFCSVRLLMAFLAGIVLLAPNLAKLDDAIRYTVPSEFITALGMGVFGVLADSLILAKKPSGVTLGWIALGFTVMSIGVGIWQASIKYHGLFLGADAARNAALIGVGIGVIIRFALVAVYGMVLTQAKHSLEQVHEVDEYSTYAY